MTVEQMRRRVMTAYDNISWKRRVEKMPEKQIIALYFKFTEDRKIPTLNKPVPHQMNLEDFGINLR